MSLLRGLAERALGTARPVRSQRAGLLHALHRDTSVTDPFVPASERASASPISGDASSRANAAQPHAAAMATRETPTDMRVEAQVPPLVVVQRDARDPATPTRRQSKPAHSAEAAPTPHAAAHDPVRAAHADASMPDPELLVARAAPSRESLPPRSTHAPAPRRERAPARAAAVPPTTEVHVRIGRVELTALPAATPPRAARSREANGHGLGDYLRGSRGRS